MGKNSVDIMSYKQEITRYDNKLKLEEHYFKNKRLFSPNKQEIGIVSINIQKSKTNEPVDYNVFASAVTDVIQILCDIYADANGDVHSSILNKHPYLTVMGLYDVVEEESLYRVRLCYSCSNGFLKHILNVISEGVCSVKPEGVYSFDEVQNENTVPERAVRPIDDPNKKYLYKEFNSVREMTEFLNGQRVGISDIVLATAVLDKPALVYYGKEQSEES